MRRVLLMHAREHRAAKRGGGAQKISLDETAIFSPQALAEEFVYLDELLNRLSLLDEQQERVVELRFFSGLSVEETASSLHRIYAVRATVPSPFQ